MIRGPGRESYSTPPPLSQREHRWLLLYHTTMTTSNPLGSRTDVISDVLAYCPLNNFLYLAGVSKTWRAVWLTAHGQHKHTAISMAVSSPARTKWVLDDEMFWLTAEPKETVLVPTTDKMNTNYSNSSGNIFLMFAASGNLFGLEAAARKLRWNDNSLLRSSNHLLKPGRTSHSNCFARRRVPEIAADIGHLEMLKWAVCQEGCPLNPSVWFFVARRGRLDVLEWLHRRGCPSDLYSCTAGAASGGKLAALKWSRQRGHGWDRFVCFSAAHLGNLEMLRWATRQGCPWDKHQCASIARANGHHNVVEWLNSHQTSIYVALRMRPTS